MTPHLRGHVRPYIDRSLPAVLLHAYDQHLVACQMCRVAAEQERRIVSTLRADAGVPAGLRAALLGLGDPARSPLSPPEPLAVANVSQGASASVAVPAAPVHLRAPASWGGAPVPAAPSVPTVRPGAPALHRSPVRAAIIGVVAAGASVVAAVGITAAVPTASIGGSSSRMAPANFAPLPSGASGSTAVPAWSATALRGPQVLLVRLPSAQSGP